MTSQCGLRRTNLNETKIRRPYGWLGFLIKTFNIATRFCNLYAQWFTLIIILHKIKYLKPFLPYETLLDIIIWLIFTSLISVRYIGAKCIFFNFSITKIWDWLIIKFHILSYSLIDYQKLIFLIMTFSLLCNTFSDILLIFVYLFRIYSYNYFFDTLFLYPFLHVFLNPFLLHLSLFLQPFFTILMILFCLFFTTFMMVIIFRLF